MWPFRKKRAEVVPLFAASKENQPARLETWAISRVGVADGLKMLTAQAANEALRNCRIGKVTRKAA